MKKVLFVLAAVVLFLPFRAHSQTGSASNVESIFAGKIEVYFSFTISNRSEIEQLTRMISIDKVDGNTLYAYANKRDFQNFLALNKSYTILPSPGYNPAPNMKNNLDVRQTLAWDFYPTYSAYETMMAQFQTTYPALCKIDTILNLASGRRILVAKISDNVNTAENEPQFMYVSSIHGDEITCYVNMLRLIDYLLVNYGTNSQVANLVNNIEIWICPLGNPDGTYYGGNSTVASAIRGNGSGIDLNRNFPDPQNGQHPDGNAWQPETQAYMTFAQNQHFNMAANFHGGAELCNYPWDTWANMPADTDWWVLVSKQFADSAQTYGPVGYFNDNNLGSDYPGVINGYTWYELNGGRQDYMNYWHHSREETIEVSATKNPAAATLPTYWNAMYRSFLFYMRQSLYGARGVVTDNCTGQPIKAKVFISGFDVDSSHVYSALPVGNYHRYLYTGSYNLTFSAPGYTTQTINNVSVTNGNTTTLNVAMVPSPPNADFVADNTSSCTGIINFTNNSTVPSGATYLWTFGDGNTSTLQSPTHTYTTNGTYSVKLKIISPCTGNDSIIKTNYITINTPTAPTVTPGSRCGAGTVVLGAAGSGTLNWYAAATGGASLGTGTSYTTPSISATTTYYVENNIPATTQNVGPTVGGASRNVEAYLYFDVSETMTLVSVQAMAGTAGTKTITLLDNVGATVHTANVTVGTTTTTITLNWLIPPGTGYQLMTPVNSTLYRLNSGVSYPYTVAGLVSITGCDIGSTYYYSWFNWTVKGVGCSSARTPVVATINTPTPVSVAIASNAGTSICTGTSVTFTATPTNGGTTPTYQWKKNTVNIAGATNSTYTTTTLVNNDQITCTMTSNATCITGSPATSGAITMTVLASAPASVAIAA
ncbi:MAG: M14 family zinc carboxypeptidase, partial [Bacteroidota bacterium]